MTTPEPPDAPTTPGTPASSASGSASDVPRPATQRSEHGLRLATVGGVPVYLGRGWAVIGLVMILIFGPQISAVLPRLGATAYVVAAAYAVLLFLSVLVHEAAHAIAARACGYPVTRIVANLWGGHTTYDAVTTTPARSALIAVVGPASNAVLAALGWWLAGRIDVGSTGILSLLVSAFTLTNGLVAVFNLLPGLPLDGGYLLEAVIWGATGRRSRGLIVAGWSGRLVTIGVLAWFLLRPILAGGSPDFVTLAWMAFLGMMLWSGAGAAIAQGRTLARVDGLDLRRMIRPAVPIPQQTPVGDVLAWVAQQVWPAQPALVALADDQTPLGVVDLAGYLSLHPSEQVAAPAGAFVVREPDGWVVDIPPAQEPTVADIISVMNRVGTPFIALRAPGGSVYAVVNAHDIAQALP